MLRRTALAALIVSSLAMAADAPDEKAPATGPAISPKIIKYHDGKADGRRSFGGGTHMIQFTMPEGATTLTGVAIHGSRYGMPQPPKEDFTVSIMDEANTAALHTEKAPYRLFVRGPDRWVTVRFEKPVQISGTFWVVVDFEATQTKGVYVSYDKSTGGQYSRVGGEAEPQPVESEADWMIQAVVK